MSGRTSALKQRRSALVAHSAIQRRHLAQTADQIEARLDPIDRGISTLRRYAAQPLLLVGGLALLATLGPKRLINWASRGAVFFTAGRRIMRLLR